MTLVIGLTGPIGCGKSTVAGWLAPLGAVVVDADRVARDVVEPDGPAFGAVADMFGSAVLAADGSIDRATLGRIVFADPAALVRLEAIVQPAVRPRILAAIEAAEAEGARAVIVEAIRLVEGGLAAGCDEIWLVVCDPAEQRRRLAGRGAEPADAERRIDAQGDLAERLRSAATRVIDTSGAATAARARVEAAFAAALDAARPR